MSSYKDLLNKKAELDKQIADARQAEVRSALEKIHTLMTEYGLSTLDIDPRSHSKNQQHRSPKKVEAKYRDPVTGQTWTGRGKPPRWIADKNRDDFAIQMSIA